MIIRKIFRIILITVYILLIPLLAVAAEEDQTNIQSLKDTITIKRTGEAEVTTIVQMEDYDRKELYIPLNYLWVDRISAVIEETGESLPCEMKTLEGIDYLFLELGDKSISDKTIKIQFRDPAYLIWKNAGPEEFGIYTYRTEFRNTIRFLIEKYEMEVILPEGYTINSFIKSTPAFTSKDPEPPYSAKNLSDGSHLYIKAKNLSLGKVCMLEYTFVEKKSSYFLLVACIIIMLLFLIFFKDTLKGK